MRLGKPASYASPFAEACEKGSCNASMSASLPLNVRHECLGNWVRCAKASNQNLHSVATGTSARLEKTMLSIFSMSGSSVASMALTTSLALGRLMGSWSIICITRSAML